VIEKGTPPGEIVVEVANPTCPAALRTTLGVEIRVPKAGYTCVSIPEGTGWAPRRYLLEGPGGRERLSLDREVFNHATFQFGRPGCTMVGERFFYLPAGQKVSTGADMEKLFLEHHTCDPTVKPNGGA